VGPLRAQEYAHGDCRQAQQRNQRLIVPKIKMHLADLGASPASGSVDDLAKLIADETDKWGKVIRAANIKAG
jgi:hypothetical protein